MKKTVWKKKEVKEKKEKEALTPAQKKKRRKRIILGSISACLVLLFAVKMLTPTPPPVVSVSSAKRGELEQTVETSGTVLTERKKTYFSPLAARVSECRVQTGDIVQAGDVLVLYDASDLESKKAEAGLQNDEAYYTYQNTMDKNNKDASEYSRSSHDIGILEEQVAAWKEEVKALKQYITDLGCHLRDAQKDGKEDFAAEVQSKIDQATNNLSVKEEELAEFESNLAEQKGIRSSAEASMLTASGKKQIEAAKDLAALQAWQVSAAVAQISEGVKAEFDGVVTDIKAVEGSTAAEGGELLTVESSEEVCVEISLGKSDLEKVAEGQKADITVAGQKYEGTVERISHSAQKNDKGAAVVYASVHIDDPDENLFLGVDAKVKIHGEKADDAVLVPVEAVNVGKDGSFVYLVEDGLLSIRYIETGIMSTEYIEAKSGLEGGEQIVLGNGAGLEEGTAVTAVEG